ncbi:MAG: hypothetical protein NW237_00430 [Cyanobacteriota bacterium]|nr:hypothetical protein [Cyanobacteriota bacterium]
METLALLHQVTQDLHQDPNLSRIKKLIFYTCHNKWENDARVIDDLNLNDLLEELYKRNSTLEQLIQSFGDAIKHINKKAEYAKLAKIIVERLGKLYGQPTSTPPPARGIPPSSGMGHPPTPITKPPAPPGMQLVKPDYNPFALRSEIFRQSNPLRAKLLLYALLYQPIPLNDQGLAILKRYSLDELLRQLFETCPTPEDLESKVRGMVSQMEDPDQTSQVASALIYAMKPLYIYEPLPQPDPLPTAVGGLLGLDLEDSLDGSELSWLNGGSGQSSRITEVEQPIPGYSFASANPPPLASPPITYTSPPPPFPTSPPPVAPASPPRPSPAPFSTQPPLASPSQPEEATWQPELPITQTHPAAPTPPLPVRRTTPPHPLPPNPPPGNGEQVELDERIRRLVDKNANALMITIENTLSELGNQLDERLQDEDPAEYLSLKHQVLRGFLKDVEGSASTFTAILNKLQAAEQRLLQADVLTTPSAENIREEDPYSSLREILVSSELVRSKPELDEDIKRLVRRSISMVKTAIENKLSEFGNILDESFQARSLAEALTLKYQALHLFIREITEISGKFTSMLSKMEEAERRLFGL